VRQKLVKCYILSIALYGAGNWTLQKVDQNTWEVLKFGAGERWRSVGSIV
jgi:accessory gene regulator protein AgrB